MKKLFLNVAAVLSICLVHAQSVGIGTNNPSGKFHISNDSSGSDALFFVDTTGNVGIGTMAPQNKLDVAGGITAQSTRVVTSSATVTPFRVEQMATVVDQQQSLGDNNYSDFNAGWQSFTAGNTGTLERVVIYYFGLNTSAVMKIYAGEGTGGAQLASANIAASVSGVISIANLSIPVVAGNKYTIGVNIRYGWLYSGSDVYSGGRGENASIDHRFKTYIHTTLDRLQVGSNGNIGIGTDSAFEKLLIKTNTDNYGMAHTDGNIILGTFVGGTSIYGGWIGTKSNHPLLFFTNNGSSQMTLLQNGNVGIGTVDPVYKLQVSGLVAANGFVNTSDARLKKDIVPLSNALSNVLQMQGVSYCWNREAYPQYQFDTNHKIGFLAQDIEKIMPGLVATGADGYKTVNYIEVVPLLVESIKELKHLLDEQQKLNELLKERLDKIETSVTGKK